MKKMKIEKQLIFADHVQKVVSLEVQKELTYKHEEDGIRAMGTLSIQGQYEGDEGIEDFSETLEMDVLAPQEKLSGEDFYLEIAEYQGVANADGITIYVTLHIHGLKETKKQEAIAIEAKTEPSAKEEVSVPIHIPTTIKEYPKPDPVTEVLQPTHVNTQEPMKEGEEFPSGNAVHEFEDLFPDAESTYTSYRIIVAKPNDTYTGIAQRYEVDEVALRDTNKNKEILPKTLVILPFQQK